MKKLVITISGLLLVTCISILLLYAALPTLINHYGNAELQKRGLDFLGFSVDRITHEQTTLSFIMGSPEQPAVNLPRIEIHYTPREVRQGKFRSFSFQGGSVHLDLNDKGLHLRGFGTSPSRQNSNSIQGFPLLPLVANQLSFSNFTIILHRPQQPPILLNIDSTVEIQHTKTDQGYHLNQLAVSGKTAGTLATSLEMVFASHDNENTIQFDIGLDDLGSLNSLLPNTIAIAGSIRAEGTISLNSSLEDLNNFTTTVALHNAMLQTAGQAFATKQDAAISLQATGSKEKIDWSLENLALTAPIPVSAALSGTLLPQDQEIQATGNIHPVSLSTGASINVHGNLPGHRLDYKIHGDSQTLSYNNMVVDLKPFALTGLIDGTDGMFMKKSTILFEGIGLKDYNIQLSDITGAFSLPLQQMETTPGSGTLTIQQIQYRGENLATADFTAEFKNELTAVDGSFKTLMPTPLRVNLSARNSAEDGFHLNWNIPKTVVDTSSFPSFATLPDTISLSATIEADGSFPNSDSATHGTGQLRFADGYFGVEESKVSLGGIAGVLTFPRLPSPASAPSQTVTIDTVDFGTISLTDAKLTYRLEDDSSIFLEKSRLNWCNGKVEAGPARITPGSNSYSTTLYCDRLQFSELLNQFGISDTDGDGSLNGRLPIEFSEDGFFFDDGFLFSTPGKSGIVRFNNTDMLKQSLPEMDQAAYLDYSVQALENFSYNWAKLTFNSIDEDLLVSMQIDGKPAVPLPYGYKGGHLVKSSKGNGIQHPLRLDVNFHLPFAEMFQYGQSIQKIMENLQ